jgi:type II secretory pathway pseudopilin PulG
MRFPRLAPALALLIAGSSLATPVLAQSQADEQRFQQAQQRLDNELNVFRTEFDRYQQARARGYRDPRATYPDSRNDPRYSDSRYADPRYDDRDEGNYDPSRYYRGGSGYQERVLTSEDRIYRGSDNQYYCKRNDGTTGLIVGAVGGGVLGNVIAGGHSRGVGTILGAIAGGVVGKSVDQNNTQVRCR